VLHVMRLFHITLRRFRPFLVTLSAILFNAHAAQAQTPSTAPALLAAIFQDHAVLQRNRPLQVWGVAQPGDRITVSIDGRTARGQADGEGQWRATLPSLRAGGPYTLRARTRSGASQTIEDVLVGDVFLCSGQSNMGWPVSASMRATAEIAASANDQLRLLTVANANAPAPSGNFQTPVHWVAAAPETAPDFSAACYYFARELAKSVHTPIGLIAASVGGSTIETWISDQGLRALGRFDAPLDLLSLYARDRAAANLQFGETWQSWWSARAPTAPWLAGPPNENWRAVPEPMRDWKNWGVSALARHDGMIWYRRHVRLDATQAAQDATLALGRIDDIDETWVNGHPIGTSLEWRSGRVYPLPRAVLHPGDNSIVVNVYSPVEVGGMLGPVENMALHFADGSSTPLGGQWLYLPVLENTGDPPRAPWLPYSGPTGAYNAMIAPIGAFGVRAVLWYQGESDTYTPETYQGLLTTLMADWRRHFAFETLPFLVVQLPNLGAPPTTPVASNWASLREAQRRAVVEDTYAGLVVTIDLGLPDDIHPTNKQPVGARLARAARHVIYGEAVSPSGPEASIARRRDAEIVVTFINVEGALVAFSGLQPNGFELCGADQASCRFADARIEEADRIVLDVPSGSSPSRVRFCWGDGPICTLSDHSRLPAGPFELTIQ
jgi:sialate O-acetylesterase